jgi:DNA polymerase elongation subunit (family B)
MGKPRILILDIETAPAELYGWQMFNANFGVEQVKKHPYILCVGYQWLGEGRPECVTVWDNGPKAMLLAVRDLLQEADVVVGKNSERFDYPWLNTEFLKYNIPPHRPVTHIDLQKTFKAQFRFLSNKLEYALQYLDMGGKVEHEGFKLWRKVIEGDECYRRKMVRYCLGDVRKTGQLYLRMRPWIKNHPAMRALGTEACPKCLSKNTKRDGIRRTACFHIQQHQCNNCGGYFSGKRTKVA